MIKVKDILYTDRILEATEKDSLSKALSKLPSSHSAAFIFSENKQKVSLVNPYHCVIKSSLPGNANVESCLFHPPHLYTNTPIKKIVEAFIASKIHYLPVFNQNDSFAGIVSARKVLDGLKQQREFNVPIQDILKAKVKPLITIKDSDTISAAVHLFKLHHVSKLIVVNNENKLKGVLSYYDVVQFMITPRQKQAVGDKEGKKENIYNHKISQFYKTLVLTLSPTKTMRDAVQLVLDKKIGSVIIVNEKRVPMGIITTRDFFNLILRPSVGVQVVLLTKHLSRSSREVVQGFYGSLRVFLSSRKDLAKAELTVKEEKEGGLFKVLLSMLPAKGKQEIVKREGKNLKLLLQEVKNHARSMHNKRLSVKP